MIYYIVKHDDWNEPFMVFAEDIADAVNKVMKYLDDYGVYTEEGISSVERVDYDGVILF